jgi:hypothetical protein
MADLLIISFSELVTHLTPHAILDLMLAFLCKGAICHLQIINVLKVLCNRLKRLVTKISSTLNILHAILRVEGHVKPLKLQHLVGQWHVSCWESFCRTNHLFKLSKMIDWQLHHWFLEDVVSPRLHIDVLSIPRLFLVQHLQNKELNSMMKAFFQAMILHSWHWHHCINGLWKVLVKHLFSGCSVIALGHIFKLHEGV